MIKKHLKKIIALSIVTSSLLAFNPIGANASEKLSGWKTINGQKYYYMFSGEPAKNSWIGYGGEWYLFNENGVMQTGWVNYNGIMYYLDESGAKLINTTIDGYKLNEDGAVLNLNFGFDENSGSITKYSGSSYTDVVIPSKINGIDVKSIGTQAYRCSSLTSITIPNSVTNIEADAFDLCSSLKSITIPDSVTSIGKNAFWGCDNLVFNVKSEKTKKLLMDSGVNESQILLNGQSSKVKTTEVSSTKVISQWKQDSKGWWYAEGNSYVTGWRLIDGNWYYFNPDGYMDCDTIIDDYYLGANGAWTDSIPNSSICYLEKELLENISEENPSFCIENAQREWAYKVISVMDKLKLTHPFEAYNVLNCKILSVNDSGTFKITFTCTYRMPNAFMLKDLNAKAKEVVANITSSSMSQFEKERAIHDWIINNVRYGNSQYIPCDALLSHSGNCESYAALAQKMFNIAGIKSIIVEGTANNGTGTGNVGHAWNMVYIDKKWYHVDVTWDDSIFGENSLEYDYFNITDSQIGKDHTWDTSKYPSAN